MIMNDNCWLPLFVYFFLTFIFPFLVIAFILHRSIFVSNENSYIQFTSNVYSIMSLMSEMLDYVPSVSIRLLCHVDRKSEVYHYYFFLSL